jgi:hypothetical protein
MDFIEQLPDSSGFTAILVIIDCLSKQAIFVPTYDTITSLDLARLLGTMPEGRIRKEGLGLSSCAVPLTRVRAPNF